MEEEIDLENLEKAMVQLMNVAELMNKTSFNRRAMVLLLSDASKVSKANVNKLLDALPLLEQKYLKEKS